MLALVGDETGLVKLCRVTTSLHRPKNSDPEKFNETNNQEVSEAFSQLCDRNKAKAGVWGKFGQQAKGAGVRDICWTRHSEGALIGFATGRVVQVIIET